MSNNENASELNKESKIYNYISVIFENKFYPFDNNQIKTDPDFRRQIYGDARRYTYKTDKLLNVGQILSINGPSGIARILVICPSLLVEEITFPIEKVKELPILEV